MILDYFADEMNRTFQCLDHVATYDPATARYVSKYVPREETYPCIMYSKALAEKHFGQGMWKETTEYVACMKPVTDQILAEDRAVVDSKEYMVESVDDVAFQGEILLVGLRRVS